MSEDEKADYAQELSNDEYNTSSEARVRDLTQSEYERYLELEDDAAYVNWGPEWRMPSLEEEKELAKNCTWTWTTINDVKGYQVTGPNGNSIFLPAAGYSHDGSLNRAGHDGFYWTRTLTFFASNSASLMDFLEGYTHWANYLHRYYGCTVRAVRVSHS